MLFHQSIMTSYLLLNYHNLSSLKLGSNTALTCKAFSVHSTWKQSRVSFNYKCIICVTLIQRFLTQSQLISWFHITYISLSDSRKHLENQATTSISSFSTLANGDALPKFSFLSIAMTEPMLHYFQNHAVQYFPCDIL